MLYAITSAVVVAATATAAAAAAGIGVARECTPQGGENFFLGQIYGGML